MNFNNHTDNTDRNQAQTIITPFPLLNQKRKKIELPFLHNAGTGQAKTKNYNQFTGYTQKPNIEDHHTISISKSKRKKNQCNSSKQRKKEKIHPIHKV